jgi:uncharacterized ParB-like nuclease family protein
MNFEEKEGTVIEMHRITVDETLQMRTGTRDETVIEYAGALERGEQFPPIVLFYLLEADLLVVVNGFHRFRAHEKAGLTKIRAVVVRGSRRDAILYACGADSRSPLQRTQEDKRKAARHLLQDAEWALWSNREIARRVGVDDKTIAKYREELHLRNSADAQRKATRGGKEYLVKVRGKRESDGASAPQIGHSHLDGPSPAHPPASSYSPASAPLRDLPVSAAGPACVVPDDVRIEVRLALHTHRAAGVVQKIAEREEAISSGTWAAIERLVGGAA